MPRELTQNRIQKIWIPAKDGKPAPRRAAGAPHFANPPTVIVMVGLPARGKTYISKKLTRYLNWIGMPTKVFNVGEYRREAVKNYSSYDFFKPDNECAVKIRQQCALAALRDVKSYLKDEGGQVAVFDATNTTRERRSMILNFGAENDFKATVCFVCAQIFFIESVCDDPSVIASNIMEVKVSCPDYRDCNKTDAMLDFQKRIECYRTSYQPLDPDEHDRYSSWSHDLRHHPPPTPPALIRPSVLSVQGAVFHQGDRRGTPLPRQPHPGPHPEQDRLLLDEHPRPAPNHLPVSPRRDHRQPGGPPGGRRGPVAAGPTGKRDPSESPANPASGATPVSLSAAVFRRTGSVHEGAGAQRPEGLDQPAVQRHPDRRASGRPVRTVEGPERDRRGECLGGNLKESAARRRFGNPFAFLLKKGLCEEMTYDEVKEKFPEEFALRDEDKYYYRYPAGESYQDLVQRVEPVIMELERQENVLVICHQAVMRCLLAYFLDKSADALPEVSAAHCPEAHAGGLRLQGGVHLPERGGGEHPQRQTRGGEKRSGHLAEEEQRDSSDQPRVEHQEAAHRRAGRASHPGAASIGCLSGSLQPLALVSGSERTGRASAFSHPSPL
ncbi:unnamed protein product [Tetraodon nigroviridis]|uniref:(spotted green pufferfish) hypothetical protein n=1 Tax=Tetraodon nigroviridis TaxID=99883 RepID=Q4SSV4_TETNG|nr:unnamed protein product [Tetraodon nigroviridis]